MQRSGSIRVLWRTRQSLILAALSCSSQQGTSDPPAFARTFSAVQLEWDSRPIAQTRSESKRRLRKIAGTRVGGGLLAAVLDSPAASIQVMLRMPNVPAVFVHEREPARPRSIRNVTQIANVTSAGVAWYYDAATRRLVSQDIGGIRSLIGVMPLDAEITNVCAINSSTVAYTDALQPGVVLLWDLERHANARRVELPSTWQQRADFRWPDIRLAGSYGELCLAYSARLPGILVIAATEPTYIVRLMHVPLSVAHDDGIPYTLDATTTPGGVAVLVGGGSDSAGRLVDLYADDGIYIASSVLPTPATRMAGAPGRLYAMQQTRGGISISSYALPATVRRELRLAEDRRRPIDRLPPQVITGATASK